MTDRKKAAEIVPLFTRRGDVAEEVSVGRPARAASEIAGSLRSIQAVNLADRPKALFVIGAGNTGKTTFLRWVTERLNEKGSKTAVAALDPENRELRDYFEGVQEPPSHDPAAILAWLERFLEFVMEHQASAALDFGGGDTSLARLAAETPNTASTMDEAGVSAVAIYLLSPRLTDLSAVASMENLGFQPSATAIVLNEGRADPTMPREEVFDRTMRHSVYRAAIDRGAVQLWMPRLLPAKEVEDRRLTFVQARDAILPEGRKVTPLGPFDRARVRLWLERMEAEFAPIASWLP